jgi:hypothetical protein
MRACQFCGAPVESAEPVAAETPEAAPGAAPDATPPVAESPEASPATAAQPDSAPPLAQPPSTKSTPAALQPKKPHRSYTVPIAVCAVAIIFIFFLAGRVLTTFSSMNQSGPASIGKPAPQADAASPSSAAATDLGVDVYPGAHPLSDPDRHDAGDSTVVSQSFLTSDKMDYVINFYKARMVGYTSIYASGNGVVVSINPDAQDSVLVAIAPASAAGQTRISITHTTTKSAH